jgi:hypothetical protein
MRISVNHIVALSGMLCLLSGSCQKQIPQEGGMDIWFGRSPAEFSEVRIDVREVKVRYEDETVGNKGWVSLSTYPGAYNVISDVNTTGTEIASGRGLSLGKIAEVCVVLGNDHMVITKNGDTLTRLVASQKDEPVIALNSDISTKYNLQVQLNVDVAKSVIIGEDSTYTMIPVICIKRVGFH